MADVTFSLPSEEAFTFVESKLIQMAHRFGMRPSRLLCAILLGEIIAIPQRTACMVTWRDCEKALIVVMETPDDQTEAIRRTRDAWPETHGMRFGEFVLNLALGHYDLREAPRKRKPQKSNGHARRCRICGRPLKSPQAIAAGIGPVCTAKMRQSAA